MHRPFLAGCTYGHAWQVYGDLEDIKLEDKLL
jgi:hypothetical protein